MQLCKESKDFDWKLKTEKTEKAFSLGDPRIRAQKKDSSVGTKEGQCLTFWELSQFSIGKTLLDLIMESSF